MSLASLIESQLSSYVAGEISLNEFEDWFAGSTWDIRNREGEAARRLAYAIELRLAEHSAGHLTESEMKHEFRQLLAGPSAQPLQPATAHKAEPK
jgi:hypothetical protein